MRNWKNRTSCWDQMNIQSENENGKRVNEACQWKKERDGGEGEECFVCFVNTLVNTLLKRLKSLWE